MERRYRRGAKEITAKVVKDSPLADKLYANAREINQMVLDLKDVLDRITLMAGSALDEDVRGEIALLRDELEMLKRAFRRHCAETGQD